MNHKYLIIYKSKTGFTERYAKWICEELSGEMVSYEQRKSICFDSYDTVIFGGGFYAGMISGLKWFKKKLPELNKKEVIVFATGATPSQAADVQKALKQNFTVEEWNAIKVFYMQGGLNYEKMNKKDKVLMAMFRKILKKSEGESEAYKMLQQSYDYTKKEAVYPLLEYCKKD